MPRPVTFRPLRRSQGSRGRDSLEGKRGVKRGDRGMPRHFAIYSISEYTSRIYIPLHVLQEFVCSESA